MATATEVVLGVDVGTTSTKVVAVDSAGTVRATASRGYELSEPALGFVEQDPDELHAAVLSGIAEVAADARLEITALAFSSVMHSLVALDANRAPLTASVTWADTRASEQAERLRASPAGLRLHRRTGTPVHPMSPLTKLLWFREQRRELAARVRFWAGIKDLIVARLTGELVTDLSLASGMGLMDIHALAWDPEALGLAGVDASRLPPLVPTTTVLPRLTPEAAAATGLRQGTPVVVGAGDGPLANLGVGAVRPGVAACSIGTSGALRVAVDAPSVDPAGGVFCYALTDRTWVVGGAINNGGVVLDWTGDALAPDLGAEPHRALLDLAAGAPAGSGGLVMLPYLLGERAPRWSGLPSGAYVGLTREHRREHLVRAALEGVCLQLSLVLESMSAAGIEVREIRATGGFARSALWRQILADAFGTEVHFVRTREGSGIAAAPLGMLALGMVESVEDAAGLVLVHETVAPEPRGTDVLAGLRPVFAEVYDALLPTFASLRRLGPELHVDRR